jgi:UDP-N-acetylglucosamine 2-epimerase (non-hydrolysing)
VLVVKVVSIVGARPQFVKLKPVDDALVDVGVDHVVIHTGQHYDARMSQAFFEGLDLPDPAINLEVGSGPHGQQTGRMLEGLEAALESLAPDWVLVYGDTNSTLAGALAAAKLHLPMGHVEAGLRSFNQSMPEEINRIATDHVSDLLFAPTQSAVDNLSTEGLAERTVFTGDVMADLLMSVADKLRTATPAASSGSDRYVVATIHRASNTDDAVQLGLLLANMQRIPAQVRLIAHPRLRDAAAQAGLTLETGNVTVVEPLPYLEMLRLVADSAGVVTDSGGLQKEAYLLRVPCTTLRAETEWIETLQDGSNFLDPTGASLETLAVRPLIPSDMNPYGDGHAARRIATSIAAR